MPNFTKLLTLITISMSLFSCKSITPQDYAQNEPKLDIRKYLSGNVKAWGILEDRSGKITRRFTVDMIGTWNGNKGVLDEKFIFDDGEKSARIWTIEVSDNNNFTATAADVVGKAIGKQYGNTIQMAYTLDLEVAKGKRYNVVLDDWMYLLDEKTLVNKSEIKKFGITFGKLTIFFKKD
ncbi:MAG: DUF3833 domain-containing protein [Pseudomonadota bacterium]